MNLFLFTYEYPYGKQETFLENELPVLSTEFKHIYIIPTNVENLDSEKRIIPTNVKVIGLNNVKITNISKSYRSFIRVFVYSLMKEKSVLRKFLYLKHVLTFFKYYNDSISKARRIEQIVLPLADSTDIFYTYWFLEGLLSLCLIKDNNRLSNKLFSRCHGYDLYDEMQGGVIPFRAYKMKFLDKLFSISDYGFRYLEKRVYEKDKIGVSKLGTLNPMQVFSNYNKCEKHSLLIVSCSNLVPVKRIHLIVEALKKVKNNVKWVHFGDGELMKQLVQQIDELPNNVSVELKGRVSNKKVHQFYKDNIVNLFINVSSSEGVPVSIMEAISYGVTVFATNVGGNKELVNEIVGKLVDVNFELKELSEFIDNFDMSILSSREQKMKIHQFWNNNFDAKKNYYNFSKTLKVL